MLKDQQLQQTADIAEFTRYIALLTARLPESILVNVVTKQKGANKDGASWLKFNRIVPFD